MIEKIIRDYLNSINLSYPVYLEIPKDPPAKYYSLEKTGGNQVNHISSSTFAVKSYADSLYEAASMNEVIKSAMIDGLITLNEITKVSLNSDYNFTDPASKKYRYQAVFDIKHY